MDVFNIPSTAHYIGGCVIGDSPQTGVVDAYRRVYGHPRTARRRLFGDRRQPRREPVADNHRASRAGEPDPRPPRGTGYRRIRPVEQQTYRCPKSPPVRCGCRFSRRERAARQTGSVSQNCCSSSS